MRYDLRTPEGTRDYLYEDCVVREQIEKKLHRVFQSHGYCQIMTPGLEFYDVFHLNSRYFPQEMLYKLTDHKGRLLVIRPDSTMPIARIAATRLREAPLPLRFYYNQSVYTASRSLSGHSNEIRQTGIELIGCATRRADLEILSAAAEALSVCGEQEFILEIGHVGFFHELVRLLPVEDEIREKIRNLIEAKNYPALNDVLDEIGDTSVTQALKQLPRLFGGVEVLEKASELIQNEKISGILKELKEVYLSLCQLGYRGRITLDLGIVNRADYYTGLVMKGYLEGYGEPVLSGGRYDKLISEFGYDVPATGFAVNTDAVASTLRQKGITSPVKRPDVLVFGEEGYEIEAILHAKRLISQGLYAETAVQETLEEARAYASSKGISKIILVGKEGAQDE